MAKQLKATVVVFDEGGMRHEFGPGAEVPEWAAQQITNLKAWADEDGEDVPEPEDDESADEDADAESDAEESTEESSTTGRRSTRRSRS